MIKKKRYSRRYFLLSHGNIIGMIVVLLFLLVRFTQSVRRSVPDTSGTNFWFTTPLCSAEFPANLHVVPQTTLVVNVTLVSLDASVVIATNHHTIETGDALYVTLPCPSFAWGQVTSSTGFIVSSTSEVNIYIDYKDDSHVVFPTDVIGYKFKVTTLTFSDFTNTFIVIHGNNSVVELSILGTVQSPISIDNVQYMSGSKTNITFPINGVVGISCSCDLTGAVMTSDLPLIVFTGALRSSPLEGFIEQVPPTGTWGRQFIFPSHSWMEKNVTVVITGEDMAASISIKTGDTTFTTGFTHTLTITKQLQLTDFLSVQANSSILCAVIYVISDTESGQHMAFRYLTPLILYHVHYNFKMVNVTNDEQSVNLILKQTSFQYVTLNKTINNPFEQAMTYFWNYFISQNDLLSSPCVLEVSDKNSVPLHGTIFRRNNLSAYEYSLGMRIVSVYNACTENIKGYGGNGDGIDNDCDNSIDEEQLNKVDDDNDGLVDEDVKYSGNVASHPGETVWEYHIRNKEKEETGLSISVISIVISISVAVTSVVCFIGGMFLAEKIRRSSNSTRVTPIC